MSIRKSPLYRILLWGLLLASIWLLAQMAPTLFSPDYMPADDFWHFWEAGRLNNHGQNPYEPQLQFFNPPWTLPVVMLFALLEYPVSRVIWLLVNVAIMIFCAERFWLIYHGNPKLRWVAWLLVFTFSPVIVSLQKGQFTPLVLLGMVGFLLTVEQPRYWFLAGLCAALIAIKPELFYLFWLALLLWSLQKRSWPILISCALTFGVLIAIPLIFYPPVIAQYLRGSEAFPITEWATPTLGAYLRLLLGLEKFWLQFVPPALGAIWMLFYWRQKRHAWRWQDELPLLVMVSVVTTAYGWTYDQALLVPALLAAAIWWPGLKDRRWGIACVLLYVVLNVLNLVLHRYWNDFWFVWLAPGFFLCFLGFYWQRKTTPLEAIPA